MQNWSDTESADCMGLCLTGKAIDLYAVLTEGKGTVPYAELMQPLLEGFGAAAQDRFQISQQKVESLEVGQIERSCWQQWRLRN
ncbi:hypothetical protein DPMN_094240 [Dreissena polymorpha]|uniref:Uncharacterized protein n=1 Tax=Dreissena polymorpha TaxID=45954 RepID=A0A9D4L5E9_DREPO|nr:hypothetical protein DPMN_094240 [Dreissena polymorpha]